MVVSGYDYHCSSELSYVSYVSPNCTALWKLIVLLQATLVTITCQKIRNLGMDLRTRPYTYLETSQLDLDSLVLYTTSITVDVSNYIHTYRTTRIMKI